MVRLIWIIIALAPFALTLAVGVSGFRAYDLIPESSPLANVLPIIGYVLYVISSLACVLNFYLSFVRYPLHRWRFGEAKYHGVSGVPLFGTLLVMLGLPVMPHAIWPVALCFVLLLVDTGGPLWFVKSVWRDSSFWEWRRSNKSLNRTRN
jgi:hypothetical protein